MKTYPYNRTSTEGRRLFRLLDAQFNKGSINAVNRSKTFESYGVPSVTQCRVNKISFLFSSNLSGVKRPQIRVDSDVEMAWGDFAEGITSLDFTHDNQELPLSYVQPLEDDALKMLIDAGFYREERFEALMNKLMADEEFDAEAEMRVTYLDAVQEGSKESVPVLLVDPVTVVHENHDSSEQTTIANLVKRSARLAMELQKEGVKTEELVRTTDTDQDREVFLSDNFRDVVAQKEEEQTKVVDESFTASSEFLDEEIDVTKELKGSLSFDHTSEDDRIRDLKERDRYESSHDSDPESEFEAELNGEPEIGEEYLHEQPGAEPAPSSKTTEASKVLDSGIFDKGLDDYKYETEDDGPEL
ncbi:hypothetical protein JUJ52_03305 [Virgibacillus sp. AGTR]|uniref:hypothetical protein n=1 Tax=Virgibacillus sp. AGTR TaxID=2812055 RepID=UPI001D1642C9|nr:hypothetical protein [Virgibacillus sp. AGTR]MCC2248985.1 hypothetical protein [Virgibacillus sp. AGTR]